MTTYQMLPPFLQKADCLILHNLILCSISVSQDNVPKTVEIARFHVKAQIQMRYAKSEIELKIQNPLLQLSSISVINQVLT